MASRNNVRLRWGAGAVLAAGVPLASADVIRAKANSTPLTDVNITMPAWNGGGASHTGNATTTAFRWTRTDSPGAGVDTTVPQQFPSYCVDINQNVGFNTDYTFQVLSLSEAGYSPSQSDNLRKLWASYFDSVNSSTGSAAFQSAVWEIVFDNDLSLDTGAFKVNSPSSTKLLSQTWLSGVQNNSYGAPLPNLVVLRSPTYQDQITVIPAPAGIVALAGCCGMLAWRRRPHVSSRA